MTLDADISSAFIATQVLLVFMTVLFTLYYKDIIELINNNENIPSDNDKYKLKDKLKELIKETDDYLNKCNVLVIINGVIFILFLPIFGLVLIGAIEYIISTNITQWNYNFTQTSFFVITLMIMGFLYKSIRLSLKMYSIKKEVKKRYNNL